LALSWISVHLSSLSQPLLKLYICVMNVYLEPIFHIVEMDTNWIEYIYYIILVEKSHWVLGCYQTQKLPSCRSIQLVSKIMFKISGFFPKKKESHKPHCRGEIYWGANWKQMTQLTIYY
jgi:hypothetical protein